MSPLRLTLLAALLPTLVSCGNKADGEVVAKVNGQAITTAQLDYEISRLPAMPPDQAQAARRQALRNLADRRLLAGQAEADKLDQLPQVQQALESVREQVLASAWLDKATGSAAPPAPAELDDYYNANPWLFSERRIYKLQEIQLRASPATVEEAKGRLATGHNLNEFMQWARERGIPAQAGQTVKAAEQLPLEILPKLHSMRPGQLMALPAEGGLRILVLVDAQTQPVGREQAKPAMERFLSAAKKRDTANVQLQTLRDKAKIEFLGDYADLGKAPPELKAQPKK